MRTVVKLIFLLLLSFFAKAQVQLPYGLPSPKNTSYYEIGWMQTDSGSILASRDTTMRPKFGGTYFMWQHAGVDTNVWFHDGRRYFHYVKSGADVINALGYTPLANITGYIQQGSNVTITGLGTIGNPYVINSTGGGGGGLNSINSQTGPNITISPGSAGSDFNITQALNVITINLPTGGPGARGLISTTDWSTFNGKQNQLNGTGFVKASGTTISYDNTTYYPSSNPNGYIPLTALTGDAPILYNTSTGHIGADTSTGLTKLATQAYVLAHQSSGTITGAGNLVPLFTTTVSANTIVFSLTNASPHTFFGNFTGSSGAPSYSSPTLASADFANQGSTTTVLHGNASGNPTWAKVSLVNDINGTLGIANGGLNLTSALTGVVYGNGTLYTTATAGVGINPTLLAAGVIALDTANLHDTTIIQYKGATGDTLIFAHQTDTIFSFRFIDSAGFHHYFKTDGTLVMYSTAGGGSSNVNIGSGFRWVAANPAQIKTIFCIGCTIDSTTNTNALTITINSALTRQIITSGTSGTVTGGNYLVTFDPASVIASYNLTMPPSPTDLQVVEIDGGGTIGGGSAVITTLTVIANSGQGFIQSSTVNELTAGEHYKWRWRSSVSKWYREQ